MRTVLYYFLSGIVPVAAMLPFVVVALWVSPARKKHLLWLLGVLVFLDEVVLLLPSMGSFARLTWNWQGKLLEIAWVVLLAAVVPKMTFERFGIRAQMEPRSGRPMAMVLLILGVLVTAGVAMSGHQALDKEELLFELTMPGIAEEMIFRGVFQSLLNEVWERRWRLWGAPFSWGLILTCMLFGIVHGVHVGRNLHVHADVGAMLEPMIGGLIFGWLRERAGSVWPCIVAHNFADSLEIVGSALVG